MAVKNVGYGAAASYAVMRFGGKQYMVHSGQKLLVDHMPGNPGDQITISEVLLIASGTEEGEKNLETQRRVIVGNPLVSGAAIKLKILGHRKDKKIRIFKKKRRTGYTKRQGHRQDHTEVLVEDLLATAS